jgi:hypothetical protein
VEGGTDLIILKFREEGASREIRSSEYKKKRGQM